MSDQVVVKISYTQAKVVYVLAWKTVIYLWREILSLLYVRKSWYPVCYSCG
jgi:hypothetical protein